MSNVRLFVGYLIRGESVRDSPSGRISVDHYERWPIRVRLHWDRHLRRLGRASFFSGHGVQEGWRDGFDGKDATKERVFSTVFRAGPLLIQFGRRSHR